MLVQPRITDAQNVNRCITIMWTRTTPTLTPQSWSPNHFVLCIPKQIQPLFTGLSHKSHEASPSSTPSLSFRQVYLRETAFRNKPSTSKKKTKCLSQSRKTKRLTPLVASQPSPLTSSFTRIPSSTSQASQDNASLTTLSTTQPATHSLITPLSTTQTGQNHPTCGVSTSPVQQDCITCSLSLPQVMHFQLDPSDAICIPSSSSQVNQDNASLISLTSLSSSQTIARHNYASQCLSTPLSDSQMTQSHTTRSLLPISNSQANLLDSVHMTVCLTHFLASKASQHPSLMPISTFQKSQMDPVTVTSSSTSQDSQDHATRTLSPLSTSQINRDAITHSLSPSLTSPVSQDQETHNLSPPLTTSVSQDQATHSLSPPLTSPVSQDQATHSLSHSAPPLTIPVSLHDQATHSVSPHSLSQDHAIHGVSHFSTAQISKDQASHSFSPHLTPLVSHDQATHSISPSLTSPVSQEQATHSLSRSAPPLTLLVSHDQATHGVSQLLSSQISQDQASHSFSPPLTSLVSHDQATHSLSPSLTSPVSQEQATHSLSHSAPPLTLPVSHDQATRSISQLLSSQTSQDQATHSFSPPLTSLVSQDQATHSLSPTSISLVSQDQATHSLSCSALPLVSHDEASHSVSQVSTSQISQDQASHSFSPPLTSLVSHNQATHSLSPSSTSPVNQEQATHSLSHSALPLTLPVSHDQATHSVSQLLSSQTSQNQATRSFSPPLTSLVSQDQATHSLSPTSISPVSQDQATHNFSPPSISLVSQNQATHSIFPPSSSPASQDQATYSFSPPLISLVSQDQATHTLSPSLTSPVSQDQATNSLFSPSSSLVSQDQATHSFSSPSILLLSQDQATHSFSPPLTSPVGQDQAIHTFSPSLTSPVSQDQATHSLSQVQATHSLSLPLTSTPCLATKVSQAHSLSQDDANETETESDVKSFTSRGAVPMKTAAIFNMRYDLLQGGKRKRREVKPQQCTPLTKWFHAVPASEKSVTAAQCQDLPEATQSACDVVTFTDHDDHLSSESEDSFHQTESGHSFEGMEIGEPVFEEMEIGEPVEVDLHPHQYVEQYCTIPFPCVSQKWYERQYMLATKNVARERYQAERDMLTDKKGNVVCINRSTTHESIEDSINTLSTQISEATGSRKKHLEAILVVAKHILANGPIVKTQELGRLYAQEKGLSCARKRSIQLYDMFSNHLNLFQVYFFSNAYLVPNTPHILDVVLSLTSIMDESDNVKETVVREVTESRLKDLYSAALMYMDTHRDRLVLKGLMAELTSIRFASRLEGVKSRKGTTSARNHLFSGLQRYAEIQMTSQMVRSDMTTQQQHKLTKRVVSGRKLKEIRTIGKGRGRKLKTDQFPELPTILLYVFGDYNVREDGGGVEAHPRLTTGTLYRATDNLTSMKAAREILLSLAPSSFKISLSSCYNYTDNYRRGSRQAQQHHHGRDVNAPLSLKKPPRTGVEQLVVNLHWTTANVNLYVDSCHDLSHCLVISKDAKSVIPTDISPVQIPGPTWKKRLQLPDHTWDQSRTNSITPMTFLFLQSKLCPLPSQSVEHVHVQTSPNTQLELTRTGQSVTLLNISFFEPDTTFKCLNEFLYLLTLPALDAFFRDPKTGNLKKQLVFVVDNGPAEQPSSHIVQMSIVRLLNFLKLDKVTQVSFAEYHSKRNFVERVHAEENRVLSKHGPFHSKPIHKNASVGSKEHMQNMESVAEEVRRTIIQGSFGGHQLLCYRGVRTPEFIFSDEKVVQDFLSLNEEGKEEFSPQTYTPVNGEVLDCLVMAWGVDKSFTGQYMQDHNALCNNLCEYTTSWRDKYSTTIYSSNIDNECNRLEIQPIPDYLRWFKTCEAHYLPLEEASMLKGSWDDIPGIFLPTKVLELCFILFPNPSENIIHQISLLSWLTQREVKEYQRKILDNLEAQINAEKEKNVWKSHTLYRTHTKPQLEALCRKSNIPVVSSLLKHELVSLLAQKSGESPPEPSLTSKEYEGDISSLPTTTAAIHRFTIPYLKSVLSYHQLPTLGNKEQLVLRTYLLRHNRTADIVAREERQLRDLIDIAQEIILSLRKLSFSSHIYRKRKYTTTVSVSKFIPIPSHVLSENDLKDLFKPLLNILDSKRKTREENDKKGHAMSKKPGSRSTDDADDLQERIVQTGSKVKIYWSKEELQETDWRVGWYSATVHSYDNDTDTLTITYSAEPGIPYEEELLPLITNKKIKLQWSPI